MYIYIYIYRSRLRKKALRPRLSASLRPRRGGRRRLTGSAPLEFSVADPAYTRRHRETPSAAERTLWQWPVFAPSRPERGKRTHGALDRDSWRWVPFRPCQNPKNSKEKWKFNSEMKDETFGHARSSSAQRRFWCSDRLLEIHAWTKFKRVHFSSLRRWGSTEKSRCPRKFLTYIVPRSRINSLKLPRDIV